ncbi:GIY-YIG nuclease family protein [bacterium]|nr:GIY-YIG nuclease family protein [bacterium]
MSGTERRKELVQAYKLRPQRAGVFQIRNTANGRFFLGSRLNLDGVWNKHQFMLFVGSHRNRQMQQDWKEYGEEAFRFEIVEEVKTTDKRPFEIDEELTLLEEIWIEKLDPFGDMGYNQTKHIRQE